MIDLQISRLLNTIDIFKISGKIYRIVSECDKNHLHCTSIDKYNFPKSVIMSKEDIPLNMQIYEYKIKNPEEFIPGSVIFCYKKEEKEIKKMNAIVINCTTKMISFTYRSNHGEILSIGLTAQQIALKDIIIKKYPDPIIW